MDAGSGNNEKDEPKHESEDKERLNTVDLDSASRPTSLSLSNHDKKDSDSNESTRKASSPSQEDDVSLTDSDRLSLDSKEVEDIDRKSEKSVSSSASSNWKSRIRDLSPSRRSPSPKPDRKSKAKSPSKSKSPAGWLPASFNQMFSSYKSRSGDFRRLFKDLPDSEQLIVDYSCALQRDILVHGRLYISQNWLCFYANIFGWETFVTINCSDISSIRKEKTALVIPNAVQINTESEKYFFASFVSRDTAFTVLFRIWQNALLDQPLTPSELIHMVGKYVESSKEDSDSDKDSQTHSNEDSDMSDAEEDNTEEDNDFEFVSNDLQSDSKHNIVAPSAFKPVNGEQLHVNAAPELSVTPPSPTQVKLNEDKGKSSSSEKISRSTPKLKKRKHSPSTASRSPDIKSLLLGVKKDKDKVSDGEDVKNLAKESSEMEEEGTVSEFADDRESQQEPHSCLCEKHLALDMLNEEYPVSVDRMYEMLFTESDFYKKVQKQRKTRDLVFHPWSKTENGQLRTITYTVALNYSIGPKSSPTTEIQHCEKGSIPGRLYMVQTEVNNEGIPYGDSFCVVNKFCMTKCSDTICRLRVTSEIKYKKSVWGFVRNMVDKNASDGLREYFTFLGTCLRKETDDKRHAKRRRSSPSARRGHRRNRSIKSREEINASSSTTSTLADKTGYVAPLWQRTFSSLMSFRSSMPTIGTESKFAFGIAMLLMCLLMLNLFLTYRLLALERGAQLRHDWTVNIESLPTDAKEWAQLLQQQKDIHDKEMERWKAVLSTSIKLMNQVQDSLAELKKELH
ncbi:protein Aster-B isoform X2 [Exaiptasia diaphana]|uniref:VASt domain-containing protein n=1 Tax=Exaiptasia diaphana TaxID=2652724 RepID=A0A913XS16_EXADI|nr:protein Aster-B isoform X2 [Exaiptasia diaphana]